MKGRRAQNQVGREHYFSAAYDNPDRFASHWHQIQETTRLGGRVLEVGIGNGTVAAVLRARGLDVTTVDIDPELGPNIVADVRKLPFADHAFDTALASQVLEHLPWESVPVALGELTRVAGRGVVVSIPNADVAFALEARLPNLAQLLRLVARRRLAVRHAIWAALQPVSWRRGGGQVEVLSQVERMNQESLYCGEHFWELGSHGVRPEEFIALAEELGLRLVRAYGVVRFPYHHFFVFAKTDEG